MSIKPARIALSVGLLAGMHFAGSQIGVVSNAYGQDSASDEYAALLTRIDNLELETRQKEIQVENQLLGIEALQKEIETVPQTKAAVRGIVVEMVAEIEKVIETDLPFLQEERTARLATMREKLDDKTQTDSDLFRRAMILYDVEANYGYSVSAYIGDHPITPGRRLAACIEDVESLTCNLSKEQKDHMEDGGDIEGIVETIKDGNYVHFGRLSFMYLDLDSREGFRWSKDAGEDKKGGWVPLSSGDIVNARRSVRIARGESAPGVLRAPIQLQAAQ